MKDNVVVQFIVLILSVKAGFILLKLASSYLPQTGILGSIRVVLAA